MSRRFYVAADYMADLNDEGVPDHAVYDRGRPKRDGDAWPIAVFANRTDARAFAELKNRSVKP